MLVVATGGADGLDHEVGVNLWPERIGLAFTISEREGPGPRVDFDIARDDFVLG
jgi:hypothetical protein